MDFTRRQFLKLSGAIAATLAVVELGFDDKKAKARAKEFKIAELTPTPTICPLLWSWMRNPSICEGKRCSLY